MQIGILRVDITLFIFTFVCLERTVFFPNWFLLDLFSHQNFSPQTILGVKSTQFLVTYFVLNNCRYLSLCKMRTLWFQECKISTVLHPLNHSDSHLLNIFQFSNLLLGGGGKDGHISTQYSPGAISSAEQEGRITSLAMLATHTVATRHADSFHHTVLTHI